jgi:hypothetical protein
MYCALYFGLQLKFWLVILVWSNFHIIHKPSLQTHKIVTPFWNPIKDLNFSKDFFVIHLFQIVASNSTNSKSTLFPLMVPTITNPNNKSFHSLKIFFHGLINLYILRTFLVFWFGGNLISWASNYDVGNTFRTHFEQSL